MKPEDMIAMLEEIDEGSKDARWVLNDVSEILGMDPNILSYAAKIGDWAIIVLRFTASTIPEGGSPSRRNWGYEGTAANAKSAIVLRLTPALTQKLFNAALAQAN